MVYRFSEDAQRVLLDARHEMISLKHPYIGSEHVLLAILSNSDFDITKKLNKLGCNYDRFRDEVVRIIGEGIEVNSYYLFTPLLKRIIDSSFSYVNDDVKCVSVDKIFLALIDSKEGVAVRIMMSIGVDLDLLYDDIFCGIKKKGKKKGFINNFGIDLTSDYESLDPVLMRDKEIDRVIEILLRRTKNNPLLVGEAGVGKTAVVEELARRIALGNVPVKLRNKRIISLSISSLVAGTKYRGEFEERVNKVIAEVMEDPDIILFIDEMHTIVGAGGAEGAIDASNILKPALSRGGIHIIGATTLLEYKKCIKDDKALERRFQKVFIEEATCDSTFNILMNIKGLYEDFHDVVVNENVVRCIVDYSSRYIYDRYQPDKAIDVLDEVCAYVSCKKGKSEGVDALIGKRNSIMSIKNNYVSKGMFKDAILLKDTLDLLNNKISKVSGKTVRKKVLVSDVMNVIKHITNIDVFGKDVSKLGKLLSKTIVGQDKAIQSIVNIAKRSLIYDSDKPSSVLLVGPSGVGKTCLVKKYADFLGYNLIRLDMSEYREDYSVSKILGSPSGYVGYNDNKNILEMVKNNPNSLILVDEVEKASSSVINLFLQILDEGRIRDAKGDLVIFSNCVIMFTSNIGFNGNMIGFNSDKNGYVMNKVRSILSVELVNRFDDVVIFDYLNQDSVRKIVKNKIKGFKNKGIVFDSGVVNRVLNDSEYLSYGARKLDGLIKKEIENALVIK